MTTLGALWLPIVLSSVLVFIASSLLHAVLNWHKSEYPPVPNEDEVQAALRPFAIPPGDYMMPRAADMAQMQTPEFKAKMERGPVAVLTVFPNGVVGMGRTLALWFVYVFVVSFFAAYVTGRALGPGAAYMDVFRVVGVTAFIGYSLALWQMTIWYRRDWRTTLRATVDGLIYGLLTAGVFGWLWP